MVVCGRPVLLRTRTCTWQHLWLVSHSADASRRPPLFVRLLHYLPPPRPFFFFCRFFFSLPRSHIHLGLRLPFIIAGNLVSATT